MTPTRTTSLLLLAGLTGLSCSYALADDVLVDLNQVHEGVSRVEITGLYVPIYVEGTSGDSVRVSAHITGRSRGDDQVLVTEHEGVLRVVHKDGQPSRRQSPSPTGEIRVRLPAGTPVEVDTSSGDIVVSGALSNTALRLSTASGELRVTSSSRPASLWMNSASGDATVRTSPAALEFSSASGQLDARVSAPLLTLKADTASGAINVSGRIGAAEVSTTSGAISLDGLSDNAHIESITGDVRLSWAQLSDQTRILVKTVSGAQRIQLPATSDPGGDIETLNSKVSCPFPLQLAGGAPGQFVLYGDTPLLDLHTVSGDIVVTGAGQ